MQWTATYYVLFICLGLSIGLTGPTLPSLADQTATRVGQLGALFLAGSLGSFLGTLLGGRTFDRVRGHPALGIAQLIAAGLIALYPLLPSAWLLFIVVFGKGIADGFINTGANTLLVWTHKEKSSPYMNALHFFFGLGAFLAPFLVAQLLTIPGGYRWAYWALAAIGGLAGLRLLTLKGNPQHVHTTTTTEIKTRINYPLVISAMLFLFFYVGAEIAFAGWIYTYAFTLNLADATMAAYLTSGFWLTFTIGRLISIPLATRFKPQQMIAAALTGCLSVLIIVLIVPMSSTLVWILAMALGFCMAPIWPSGFTLAGQSLKLTARVSGLILLGDSLGGMILPWLVGQVLDFTGPQALIYLVTTSLIFNLVSFIAILRLRRTTQQAAVPAEATALNE
jgi:FHS family Na+ dependent glucose MFS transporter 1